MTFGEKILTLRKQQNISQEQLAEKMNVTWQTISDWEEGASLPPVDSIVKLSGILEVSTDYLLKDTDMPVSEEEDSFIIGDRVKLNIGKALWPLAILLFFITSNPFVFVVAWLIDEVFDFIRKGRWQLSFDDVAIVVFLILGFGLDLWNYAWLVFIAAWVLDDLIVREKDEREN